MRTRAQRWGNSLAVRIPKPIAEELHLEADIEVEMSIENGALKVVPLRAARPAYSLDRLLDKVTKDNLHGEVDTGPAVGREAW